MDRGIRHKETRNFSLRKTYYFVLLIENKGLTKVVSLTDNDLETSGLLYSAMFCIQVTIWKPAGFSILQCSASIKRTLLSFAKVVFFSFIAKVIPLKNRVNQTSYHYCTFVAHLADENR